MDLTDSVLRDYGYFVQHLGDVSWAGPQACSGARMVNRVILALRMVLVVGLLTGASGLFPKNSASPALISEFLQVSPVEASLPGPSVQAPASDAGRLESWPELEPDSAETVTQEPSKPETVERGLPSSEEKVAVSTPEAPKPEPVILAKAETPAETSPALNAAEDLPELAEEEEEGETEVVFEEDLPAETESKPGEPASKPKHKGYVIRPDGDDLVVYDSEGVEIFRKTRTKARTRTLLGEQEKTPPVQKAPLSVVKHQVVEETPPAEPLPGAEKIPTPVAGGPVVVEVKRGDTPASIARRFAGLTAEELMKANGITDPTKLRIGQKLVIPADNPEGVKHTVKAGETLSELLRLYEIADLNAVCDANSLPRTTNVVPEGTVLFLPGAKPLPQTASKKRSHALVIDPSKFKGKDGWTWPLEGELQVSSPYGLRVDPFQVYRQKKVAAGGGNERRKMSFHHGVDMSVPKGTPVKAARAGEVIKRQISRRGHGNMIEIRHDDGWCTVYSHNSELLVDVGDKVEQGQVIAYSGSTGRSTGPHLHFEIRRPDQRSVDPRLFLGAPTE
ncbi:MAG: hypothetical protein GHCLOJNM_01495 [bacterium]|nr:hypothetical protein [bacterium]